MNKSLLHLLLMVPASTPSLLPGFGGLVPGIRKPLFYGPLETAKPRLAPWF